MKVKISIDERLDPKGIIISCYEVDERILRIKKYAEKINTTLTATNGQQKLFVLPEEVYYFESIEKKTFIYLKEGVWECPLRLYELEEVLEGLSFVRISKSTIVNVAKVREIRVMINRNLMLLMDNEEKLIVSRRYVKDFNRLIGME